MLPTHMRSQINHLFVPGHAPLVPLRCHATPLEKTGNGTYLFRRRLKDLELVEADGDSLAHMPHTPAPLSNFRQKVLRNRFRIW